MRLVRKAFWVLAPLIAIACLGMFSYCWSYGVWSYDDWEIRRFMADECHPVWRDLDAGRIKSGDKIESVIWRTHPDRVEKFEDVTMLCYGGGFTGVTITSKAGRVVDAGAYSCTWTKVFIDTWEPEVRKAFNKRYSAHLNKRWEGQNAQ